MKLSGEVALVDAPRYLRQLADHLDSDMAAIRRGAPIHGDYLLREGASMIKWSYTREESDAYAKT